MTGAPKNFQIEIVRMYEEIGMSPVEIAEDREIDVNYVEAILMQYSKKYRASVREAVSEEEDITDEEYADLLRQYKNLAAYTEDPHIKERTLRFLINEKKGRNDVKEKVQDNRTQTHVVINVLNEAIKQARQTLALPNPKTE